MAKVLYIEDHPSQRDLLAQMLELSGHEVEVAEDGIDGIEKVLAWSPDIVLTDLRMPRLDGFGVIEKLRSTKETAHIPIIAISAWTSNDHQKRALAAGANQFIAKPVDITRLMPIIKSLVE